MAEAVVTIKLTALEYRFWHSEMDIHAAELENRAKGMPASKSKSDLTKRSKELRKISRAI